MLIYRFWNCRTENFDGQEVRFKAGSNDSPEAAAALVEEKIALFRQFRQSPNDREFVQRHQYTGSYETSICEELVEKIDDRNIITRNRYGALVLNSEDHAFFDIDFDAPLPRETFKRKFLELIGKLPRRTPEERLFEKIRQLINDRFPYKSFRLYRTFKGFRLVTPASAEASSQEMAAMMTAFLCDQLYMTLCAKQNCFRARLTPKPRRMKMKTALKFTFPYPEEQNSERLDWLNSYEQTAEKFRTCALIAEFGPPWDSPVIRKHDEICKCSMPLPLA
jgi:hypothetical protein